MKTKSQKIFNIHIDGANTSINGSAFNNISDMKSYLEYESPVLWKEKIFFRIQYHDPKNNRRKEIVEFISYMLYKFEYVCILKQT